MEYMMAALNGCVSVMIAVIAAEMDFKYEAVELLADGVLDVRGLKGVPGVQPHFTEVRLTVKIKTEEPRERLDELKEKVEARCPAAGLINAANGRSTPPGSTWRRAGKPSPPTAQAAGGPCAAAGRRMSPHGE